MQSIPTPLRSDLPCHQCGYDLRAHPPEGKCPECGASVSEAQLAVAVPRRPAWRDTDPRWRRRMLAGTWCLVLLPLMEALRVSGWRSRIPVPSLFKSNGGVHTLDETLLGGWGVYEPVMFCIGVILLFSKERGRRRSRLDWTRRWGVFGSYCVFLISAVQFLLIPALILAGIAALFLAMPPKYQPEVTGLFVKVAYGYLRYGPYPSDASVVVLPVFSSTLILLACVPLWNALRSSGPRSLANHFAAILLLAPLTVFSMMILFRIGHYCLGNTDITLLDIGWDGRFFNPVRLTHEQSDWLFLRSSSSIDFIVERIKWCVVLVIAVWLTIAQLFAHLHRRTRSRSARTGLARCPIK